MNNVILLCVGLVAEAMRLGKYLGGGDIPENNLNLEDMLWDAPHQVEEHCKMVAAIQSWTRVDEVDFNFFKIRADPDMTEERFNELKNSLLDTVSDLVSDLPVNSCHEPLDQARAMSVPGDADDEEFKDLNINQLANFKETIEDRPGDASRTKDTGTSGGTGSGPSS